MRKLSKRKASEELERVRVDLDLTYDDLAAKCKALELDLSRAMLFALCAGTWPHKLTARTARRIERFIEWADREIERSSSKPRAVRA